MQGKFLVFRRSSGAASPVGGNVIHFGHVGWGFQLADGSYYFGSTENPKGEPQIFAPGDNGWWAKSGSREAMLAEMQDRTSHLAYDDYKEFDVRACDPDKARAMADSKKAAGYTVLGPMGNNCANHVWDIANAYGIQFRLLQLDPMPNEWFMHLDGGPVPLKPAPAKPAGGQEVEPLVPGKSYEGPLKAGAARRFQVDLDEGQCLTVTLLGKLQARDNWTINLSVSLLDEEMVKVASETLLVETSGEDWTRETFQLEAEAKGRYQLRVRNDDATYDADFRLRTPAPSA